MDWRKERARVLREARCVVVKVGSAVLTSKQGLDDAVMEDVVTQLAALRGSDGGPQRRVVLVSSGAVAAGRAALGPGQIGRAHV